MMWCVHKLSQLKYKKGRKQICSLTRKIEKLETVFSIISSFYQTFYSPNCFGLNAMECLFLMCRQQIDWLSIFLSILPVLLENEIVVDLHKIDLIQNSKQKLKKKKYLQNLTNKNKKSETLLDFAVISSAAFSIKRMHIVLAYHHFHSTIPISKKANDCVVGSYFHKIDSIQFNSIETKKSTWINWLKKKFKTIKVSRV